MEVTLQPRIIRAGQAPAYCGMGRDIFAKEIRPFVSEIDVGQQGIGFCRLELDAALDEYISRRGRAPAQKRSNKACQKMATVSVFAAGNGTSKRGLTDSEYANLLDQAVG